MKDLQVPLRWKLVGFVIVFCEYGMEEDHPFDSLFLTCMRLPMFRILFSTLKVPSSTYRSFTFEQSITFG